MKKTIVIVLFLISAAALLPAVTFPDLPEWNKKDQPQSFTPDNLYEYINGAADNFLAYDFREMTVQNYEKQKQTASVEIYHHGSAEAAFGIYASEKSPQADYVTIGGEGYYEEGILNFLCGSFYVKISAFGLGENDRRILTDLAGRVATALPEKGGLPAILQVFPAAGKIARSERFILENVFGHKFLHTAFLCEYAVNGKRFSLFILRGRDEAAARAMVEQYMQFAAMPADALRAGKDLTVADRYNGEMLLRWNGRYVLGISGKEKPDAAVYLQAMEKALAAPVN